MTSAKKVELTVRIAMLIKAASELIGTQGNVPLCRMQIRVIERDLNDIKKFLDTAEVEE